jgi:N-acetyl-alpha-D-glucosaminyl L-malate synthase BshA
MTAPLRIGITCWPTYGGSGIVATEIGVRLAARGHRVHFIASDVPSRLDRFLDGVFFHEVESRDYPLFEHGTFPLALASKMVEVARFHDLDLFHVHYAIPHATAAWLACEILRDAPGGRRKQAPPIVTTLHGTDITLVGSDPSFLPITRFSILRSDAVTAPSEFLREATYERLAIDRAMPIEVIPNFVDTGVFRPVAERSWDALGHFVRATHEAARAGGRPRVLFHNSNFRPLKRIDLVVRAFAEVRSAVPAAVLLLVGDGPERSRAETLCRELGVGDAACFLGKRHAIAEALAHADLFLLPSDSESFGLAALEAQACGVPVIASRVGGVPEVIADGESGILVPAGDASASARAAIALLSDEPRHRAMGLAARARAERHFQPGPAVDAYESIYYRLTSSTR